MHAHHTQGVFLLKSFYFLALLWADLNVSIWSYIVRRGGELSVKNSGVVCVLKTLDDRNDILLLSVIYQL